ncbi:MAG: hypothetical protein JSV81_18190 [Anaerolineales bacterium]|nr:MAG: hypothetical protein JSV81_18190 [Anaerolineales bacterium]
MKRTSGHYRVSLLTAFLAGLSMVLFSFMAESKVLADDPPAHRVYLPIIASAPACSLNPQEQRIESLMIHSAEQQRAIFTCNSILAQVARARAEDMASRGYFSHVTPEGYGPNYLVRQAGYVLPSFYGTELNDNNIESIGGGYSMAEAVWEGWMASAGHRDQLLGLQSFFADQIEYGIGYAYDPESPLNYYWVVITAKPGP